MFLPLPKKSKSEKSTQRYKNIQFLGTYFQKTWNKRTQTDYNTFLKTLEQNTSRRPSLIFCLNTKSSFPFPVELIQPTHLVITHTTILSNNTVLDTVTIFFLKTSKSIYLQRSTNWTNLQHKIRVLTSLMSCFAVLLSRTRSHHAGHLVFMYDSPLVLFSSNG